MQDFSTGLLSGTHCLQGMTDTGKNTVTDNERASWDESRRKLPSTGRGGRKPRVEGVGRRRNTGRHAEGDSPHHCCTVESKARRRPRAAMNDIGIRAGGSVVWL